MKVRNSLLAAALTTVVSAPAWSQTGPRPSPVFQATAFSVPSGLSASVVGATAMRRADDYRWEGALIGGVLAASALTFVYARACEEDCLNGGVRIAIGSAAFGGFIGLLVGGAFPKPAE